VLGIVRQQHFFSGYDLAVIDQAIWKYSKFEAPIFNQPCLRLYSVLTDHVELFFFACTFYWFVHNVIVLIILQVWQLPDIRLAGPNYE